MEFALCLLSTAIYMFLTWAVFSILYHTDMRRGHLLPDLLPEEHTDLQATLLAQ